jgi:hypothetical protein
MQLGQPDANEKVETPRQIARRVGLSEGKIRHLIRTGRIDHLWIGSRVFIPPGAWARFVAENKGRPCQDETRGQGYVGSPNVSASISPGLSTAAAASAQLARKTATKLKSLSQNGSSGNDSDQGQVIQLKSSSPTP